MSRTGVEVTWTEGWERKTVINLDLGEVEDWHNGPATEEVIRRFLDAGSVEDWHPGGMPDPLRDEFIDVDIDAVRLIGPSDG